MKISKEFKIGGLTVIAILLLMWGDSFLKGKNFFKPQTELFAVYDNVNGLIKTNPVMLNGLKIGQVESVKFLPDRSGRLIVCFFVDNDFAIPANSTAVLVSNGLLGSKALQIEPGDASQVVQSGDTLQTAQEAGLMSKLEPMAGKVSSVLERADSLLAAVNHVLDASTQADLTTSINELKTTLKHLSSITERADQLVKTNADNITQIVSNAQSFTENLKNANDDLTNVIKNLSDVSDTLKQSDLSAAIHQLSSTMQSLDTLLIGLKNGEGSAGKLLTNDSLYFELNRSAEQLHLLLEDIRLNPKKYVHISVF